MALPVIEPEDFTGWYKISQSTITQEKVQEYIDQLYPQFIIDLIGAGAYTEIVDLPDPLRDKWDFLFTGGTYVGEDGKTKQLIGLLEIAKGEFYFQIVRDDFSSTVAGKVKSDHANSQPLPGVGIIAKTRRNKAISAINCELADYFNFYEEIDEGISNITNVATTYTVEVPSTKYLAIGDTVEVGKVEYEVIAVVENVSFDVESSTEVVGTVATWKPYEVVEFSYPKAYSTI